MSQVQVPKVVPYVAIGPNSDEVSASKVLAYFLVVPGESEGGEDTSGRQGHIHTQILRRS